LAGEVASERGGIWRNALLFAIIPAVLAGIFSLAPKFYEEIQKSRPDLRYQLSSGPQISQGGQQKRIFNVQMRNGGTEKTSNVTLLVSARGFIEAASGTKTRGLDDVFLKGRQSVEIKVKTLFPNDKYTLSVLLSSPTIIPDPVVTLRSDQLIGKPESEGGDDRASSWFDFVLAGSATLVAIIVYILLLITSRKYIRRVLKDLPVSKGPSRGGIIASVALKTGHTDLIDRFSVQNDQIHYWVFANNLKFYYESGEINKDIYIRSLYALGNHTWINRYSREYINQLIHTCDALFLQSIDGQVAGDGSESIESFNAYLEKVFQYRP
jgi:hypothetical protein